MCLRCWPAAVRVADSRTLLLAAGLGRLLFLGLLFLFLALELVADQLQYGHLRPIADANPGKNNARVASRPVRELRRDLAEELLRNARRHDVGSPWPPRLQRVAFPKRDHLLRHRPRRLSARERSGDPPVLEKIGNQVPQRRAAIPRIAPQLRSRIQMSHRPLDTAVVQAFRPEVSAASAATA